MIRELNGDPINYEELEATVVKELNVVREKQRRSREFDDFVNQLKEDEPVISYCCQSKDSEEKELDFCRPRSDNHIDLFFKEVQRLAIGLGPIRPSTPYWMDSKRKRRKRVPASKVEIDIKRTYKKKERKRGFVDCQKRKIKNSKVKSNNLTFNIDKNTKLEQEINVESHDRVKPIKETNHINKLQCKFDNSTNDMRYTQEQISLGDNFFNNREIYSWIPITSLNDLKNKDDIIDRMEDIFKIIKASTKKLLEKLQGRVPQGNKSLINALRDLDTNLISYFTKDGE